MENYIIADNKKPCYVCKKDTDRVDINYECRLCSDECTHNMDEMYNETMNKLNDK